MEFFKIASYRQFLRNLIEENSEKRGFQGRLADAAGCQRSYLSKVLTSQVHLTSDHILGISHFMQFTEDQTDYLLELLNFEKAATPLLKSRCQRKLEDLRRKYKKVSSRTSGDSLPASEEQLIYYSSWIYAALYTLVSIPGLNKPSKMASRLNITEKEVNQALSFLNKIKLITQADGEWKITNRSVHLSSESPLNTLNHQNWRNVAMLDAQRSHENSIHYSSIHSMAISDFEVIRDKILNLIQESHKIVQKSPEEEIVCFCLDYFVP